MKISKSLLFGIFLGVFIAGATGFLCMPYITTKWFSTQIRDQQKQIAQQAEMIEYLRQSGLGNLMSHLLQKVEDELMQHPKRMLTDGTIAQIAALSYSFKPYKHLEGDSLFEKMLSPERGQLLLMLSGMNMDSGSFTKLLARTSFSGADLREADLQEAFLNGVDLGGANLQGARLQGAHLNGANLKMANLWGANLRGVHMVGTNLTRADLRWADLNGAELNKADLHEADLASAQLRKADLHGAVLQWAEFGGAFLREANLAGADMFRASLNRANLERTNLSGANLKLAVLSEANLTGANFTGADLSDAVVSEQLWLTHLEGWLVKGAAEIQHTYRVVDATSYKGSMYQLKKK